MTRQQVGDWQTTYRAITPLEASEARDSIVETMTLFPFQICNRLTREIHHVFPPEFVPAMTSLIKDAQVVYWQNNLWMTALNGKEVFKDTTPDFASVTPKMQLFMPDVDLNLDDTTVKLLRLGNNNVLTALFISNFKEMFEVCGIFNTNFELKKRITLANLEEYIPTFRFWHFDHGAKIETSMGMTIVALLEFMKQPFVGIDKVVPARAERRRLDKAKKKWPEVRQIVLRKMHKDYGKRKDSLPIEWSCSWLVGAHWREQYYPSTNEHKPKFINSYLKGDPDKPFKPPAKVIVSVKR